MNLLPSIVVTLLITVLIWGLLLVQPQAESQLQPAVVAGQQSAQPLSNTERVTTQSDHSAENHNSTEQASAGITWPASLNAVTRMIDLTHIDQLWADFIPQLDHVRENPQKIYVYYRQFDATYTQAKVSIGIDGQIAVPVAVKSALPGTGLPGAGRYQPLLRKGKHSNAELAEGWNKINYNRGVESVLEVHFLDADYNPGESQLFVEYQ